VFDRFHSTIDYAAKSPIRQLLDNIAQLFLTINVFRRKKVE